MRTTAVPRATLAERLLYWKQVGCTFVPRGKAKLVSPSNSSVGIRVPCANGASRGYQNLTTPLPTRFGLYSSREPRRMYVRETVPAISSTFTHNFRLLRLKLSRNKLELSAAVNNLHFCLCTSRRGEISPAECGAGDSCPLPANKTNERVHTQQIGTATAAGPYL